MNIVANNAIDARQIATAMVVAAVTANVAESLLLVLPLSYASGPAESAKNSVPGTLLLPAGELFLQPPANIAETHSITDTSTLLQCIIRSKSNCSRVETIERVNLLKQNRKSR